MFRYETCRFCKQNCKLQKMCNGSGLHTSGEGAGFVEDFGGAGALMEASASSQMQHGPQSLGAGC